MLARSISSHGSEVDLGADDPREATLDRDATIHDDGMSESYRSLESNDTCTIPPTYRTLVPEGHSVDTESTFGAASVYSRLTGPPSYYAPSERFSASSLNNFRFVIRGGGSGFKGQSWAALKLYSYEARGKGGEKQPRSREGENLFGCVELSLLGPHSIKSIKLVLKGTIITSAMDNGSMNFLEQTYTVWDRSFGDPSRPEPGRKFDGKVEGSHVFPFSIPFPKYVNLSTFKAVNADGQPVESRLPLFLSGTDLPDPEQITPFQLDSPLPQHIRDLNVEESLPVNGISPFHLDSTPTREKTEFITRDTGAVEDPPPANRISPFHLNPEKTPSGSRDGHTEEGSPVNGISPFHVNSVPASDKNLRSTRSYTSSEEPPPVSGMSPFHVNNGVPAPEKNPLGFRDAGAVEALPLEDGISPFHVNGSPGLIKSPPSARSFRSFEEPPPVNRISRFHVNGVPVPEKTPLAREADALEGPTPVNGISPFHVHEKTPLSTRGANAEISSPFHGNGSLTSEGVRTISAVEQAPIITPFRLSLPHSWGGSPSSFVGTRGSEPEPGPSTITPFIISQQDAPASTASSSKGNPRKERNGSRWSFPGYRPGLVTHVENNPSDHKPSSPVSEEEGFESRLRTLPTLEGRYASTHTPIQMNPVRKYKMDVTAVLPQSFLERDVGANTKYELALHITHGRFSSTSKVKTPLFYSRVTVPRPMPSHRRDAYQEGRNLPSPVVAPEIWHRLLPVLVRERDELKAKYTLFLANPLSYTRGTVIPCYLSIARDNASALDFLSNPRFPRVRLTRVAKYKSSPGGSMDLGTSTSSPWPGGNTVPQYSTLGGGPGGDDIKPVSNATWWVTQGSGGEGHDGRDFTRELQGEIHLPSRLQPSCPFPLFDISYRVELIASVGWDTVSQGSGRSRERSEGAQKRKVYASQIVEITTDPREDEPEVIASTRPLNHT